MRCCRIVKFVRGCTLREVWVGAIRGDFEFLFNPGCGVELDGSGGEDRLAPSRSLPHSLLLQKSSRGRAPPVPVPDHPPSTSVGKQNTPTTLDSTGTTLVPPSKSPFSADCRRLDERGIYLPLTLLPPTGEKTRWFLFLQNITNWKTILREDQVLLIISHFYSIPNIKCSISCNKYIHRSKYRRQQLKYDIPIKKYTQVCQLKNTKYAILIKKRKPSH